MDRRTFLHIGTGALAANATFGAARIDAAEQKPGARPNASLTNRICIFTDHLDDDGFSYDEVARMIESLKLTGPDLTVRPGGLVAPERAETELPKAHAAFEKRGLTIPMMSTGIVSAKDPITRPLLSAAARLGVKFYKLGYMSYADSSAWEKRLEEAKRDLAELAALGQELGIQAGLHNHAGPFVGGALWDSWLALESIDPKWLSFYFDPAQATIEGGNHGWKLGFERLRPRLKMVAVKDFIWEKSGGAWRTKWVPLGEGMVRWPDFLDLLVKTPFPGPISLHIEYDPGGNGKAERYERRFMAAERDLALLRSWIAAAEAKSGAAG